MSTPNKSIYKSVETMNFYSKHLKESGDSSQGVGWKNDEAQTVRFEQLSKVFQRKENFSVNDLGCGTGEFYNFLRANNYNEITYNGFDILEEMIDAAKNKLGKEPNINLYKIESARNLVEADYTVASGVFNVKYGAKDIEWLKHVTLTLDEINSKSEKGFSFNLLTSYSDKEHMQSYLYYADPLFFFDHCKKNYSKNVALLHDYNQYDFTVIVRKKGTQLIVNL